MRQKVKRCVCFLKMHAIFEQRDILLCVADFLCRPREKDSDGPCVDDALILRRVNRIHRDVMTVRYHAAVRRRTLYCTSLRISPALLKRRTPRPTPWYHTYPGYRRTFDSTRQPCKPDRHASAVFCCAFSRTGARCKRRYTEPTRLCRVHHRKLPYSTHVSPCSVKPFL